MSHPLIALASDKEVRQAASFRAKAGELGGERLEAAYQEEKRNAPSLTDAGRRYLAPRGGKPATERRRGKDEEHVAMALVRYGQARGDGLPLPDESLRLMPLEAEVRVKTGPADAPETKGIGRIDLLGITSDDRLVVAKMRVLEPSETRCGVGDTPLRSFLEALALCAIAEANLPALRTEISERFGRTLSDAPPMLVLLASSVYWRLCRRRESQRGAGWIREMERLAQEVERTLSVPVRFLSLELPGDPGWVYREDGPAIDGIPRLTLAWEPGAGRVRPKSKPRQKKPSAPEIVIVAADPSRPLRRYSVAESYRPGDRIEHPTLGVGVVQIAERGKIRVRFNDRDSVLVHERGGVSAVSGA